MVVDIRHFQEPNKDIAALIEEQSASVSYQQVRNFDHHIGMENSVCMEKVV